MGAARFARGGRRAGVARRQALRHVPGSDDRPGAARRGRGFQTGLPRVDAARERRAQGGRAGKAARMTERTASEKAILVRSCVLGALGASALVALGRFREALALTLGAAVAILSALWLSDVL